MEWIVLRTLLSLSAIIALMLGFAWVMKRFMHAGKGRGRSLVEVELLGHRSLQPRTAVYVLKVLNRVIIVGASEHGMQTLSEISDPETIVSVEDRMMQDEQAPGWFAGRKPAWAGGKQSFSEILKMSFRGAFLATKHTK